VFVICEVSPEKVPETFPSDQDAPSSTKKLSKMAEETFLKKQFQRLIRKCEKRHQEKLDQLLASDPAILDAYAPSTFGIDRAVLEEMWLMDNLIGKKFILQKLKTLYYEDKERNVTKEPPSLEQLSTIAVLDQYLEETDQCPWKGPWSFWAKEHQMSKGLESYGAHVLRNWDFIACPEEDWVWGSSLRTPEMSEDDTSDDEPSKEEGDEEDNAVEWFDSDYCALVSPQPGRPTSIPLPDPTTNWQLIPRGRAMIVVPGGKTTYIDEEQELMEEII